MDGNFDIKGINEIIKKVILEVGMSREEIFDIIDNIRVQKESIMSELEEIHKNILNVIDEVDMLQKEDKKMRINLAYVSENFKRFNENDIKEAYEKALKSKVDLINMTNKEKELKDRRYNLEVSLKRLMENIKAGEKVINQICVALKFLEGDMKEALEDADKNSEIKIGVKVLEALENERIGIARDIHDGPSQYLADAIIRADICKKLLQNDLNEGISELENLKKSIKYALNEIREILFNLRPAPLKDLGLNKALLENIKGINKDSNIKVNVNIKDAHKNVDAYIQLAVYRITQEIFNNIKKHSKAKNAEIRLDFGSKYLTLIISDDGTGFPVEETLKKVKEEGNSYGLTGIVDRVKQFQGEIKINSERNEGTTYFIKLPINREVLEDGKD